VHFPERVTAAASIYGVQLVTEEADSPHVTLRQAKARFYFACAETDHYAPAPMVEALTEALVSDGVNAEIEHYPGTEHGFAFPNRHCYDKAAAERHWERLFDLYRRHVG
jgi:carboxymethylenebutenolidase